MRKPRIWFLKRSNTNQPAQSQKQARSSKFKERGSTIRVAKTLISFTAIAQLICTFVYADCWFSHDTVHSSTTVHQLNTIWHHKTIVMEGSFQYELENDISSQTACVLAKTSFSLRTHLLSP